MVVIKGLHLKILTIIITVLLFFSCTKNVLATPPFEEEDTFTYNNEVSPAPNWEQIFHECSNTGCYEISEVLNNDGTKATWTVANGHYEIHITSHQKLTFVRTFPLNWPTDLKNYEIVFDMFTKDSINYDRNFAFRYIDQHTWYGLHFYGTTIYLEKALFNPQTQENKGKLLSQTNFSFSENQIYRFKIRVYQNSIKLYNIENNQETLLINTVDNDSPILSGKAGPQSGSWQNSPGDAWFDNIKITNLDIPSSTPTPNLSPTPSPTKVILAPGMGASWNADAILNCKLDNYQGDWTMAPFAEDIYNSLISSLESNGFKVFPFYYDWRKRIPSHNPELSYLISNLNLQDEEKVNFVGHSMGGLVGRAYLEEDDSKIHKYISAGSPHKGTALAYPAWYGGEIWNNSLVTRIAATLLIKRCGLNRKNDMETVRNIAPSFQDLLPIYPFLRNNKTGDLKGIDTNQWLKNSSFPNSTNIIIATLSGYGFETLENIKVKEPTKKEKKQGLWEEGKPDGKETTTNGDGTVTSDSTKIDGAINFEINQNHGGLVSSQEGISTIVNFLKGETTTPSSLSLNNIEEPKSALVMIAYPSTFISIDQKGKVKKDKHNVIAQMNPKQGKYKIGVLPLAQESTLLIGQFLKDGKYSWKEYKIKGKLPFVKTVKFDENNLIENPLQ